MRADRRAAANTEQLVCGFWGAGIKLERLLPWLQDQSETTAAEREELVNDNFKAYFTMLHAQKPLGPRPNPESRTPNPGS